MHKAQDKPGETDSGEELSCSDAEYDFHDGVRGKYVKRYAPGTNVVLLDPDLAEVFPDPASVNRALRALAGTLREQQEHKPAT